MEQNKKIKIFYRWHFIIVALMLFFPVGIALLVRRLFIDKFDGLKSGQWIGLVGFVFLLLSLSGFIFFRNEKIQQVISHGLLGIILTMIDINNRKTRSLVREYSELLFEQKITKLSDLVQSTGKNEERVKKELNKVITILPDENIYYDEQNREVMIVYEMPKDKIKYFKYKNQTSIIICLILSLLVFASRKDSDNSDLIGTYFLVLAAWCYFVNYIKNNRYAMVKKYRAIILGRNIKDIDVLTKITNQSDKKVERDVQFVMDHGELYNSFIDTPNRKIEVCFPVEGKAIKPVKEKHTVSLIVLWYTVFSCFFMPETGAEVLTGLMFFIGFVLFLRETYIKNKGCSSRKYAAIVLGGNYLRFDKISKITGNDGIKVKKDIKTAISCKFLNDASIDETQGIVVLHTSRKNTENENIEYGKREVVCKACGATNIFTGKNYICEYCGTVIE